MEPVVSRRCWMRRKSIPPPECCWLWCAREEKSSCHVQIVFAYHDATARHFRHDAVLGGAENADARRYAGAQQNRRPSGVQRTAVFLFATARYLRPAQGVTASTPAVAIRC